MGTRLILLCLLSSFFFPSVQAQFNADTKTLGQLTANTAAITATEYVHTDRVEKISKKMKAIAGYTTSMATIKELYRISMQNIDGFGEETQLYKAVATTAFSIAKNIPVAMKELGKRPYSAITTHKEMIGLSLDAASAVQTFVNIVNNGKVSIKLSSLKIEGSDDGYNYMNRTDRYVLANSVLNHLREINYKLEAIIYMSRFCNGISDMLYALDIDTWCTFFAAKNQIQDIVRLYQDL